MRLSLLTRSALVLLACAACADDPTQTKPPVEPPAPKPAPIPVGVFEIKIDGIGTDAMTATATTAPNSGGPSASLTPVAGAGLALETVSTGSFIDGTRSGGGQRYLTFTFRVRNGTGGALTNLTFLAAQRASTIPGTPLSVVRKFDGTNADTALAKLVVPTGVVTLGSNLTDMLSPYPDVLQAFTEAEIAAISLPADVTGLFPYGYVVRNKNSTTTRTLPATADPNQWDGLFTLSFRVPLQASSSLDVYQLTFQLLGVQDSETRMTESIEEAQDSGAVRRLRDRATALGATTVTVLNGSSVMDPAVPDYPGQRQICGLRTAGPSATPVTRINNPGPYMQLFLLRGGESLDPCAAYFRTGTPARPSLNNSFTLSLRAMDRYGNQRTVVDTVHLEEASGPPVVINPAQALVGGQAAIDVAFTDYGTAVMNGVGKRLRGQQSILVAGVTRTWTAAAATTDWFTNNNWSPAAVPGILDSVYIPVAAPLDPLLTGNVTIQGVTVEDVATLGLGAFNLTANANVTAGLTGGVTNTSGTLVLAGIAATMQGKLPRLRVTGTYSLTGNVTARAPIQSDAGRITASAFRLQADGN